MRDSRCCYNDNMKLDIDKIYINSDISNLNNEKI